MNQLQQHQLNWLINSALTQQHKTRAETIKEIISFFSMKKLPSGEVYFKNPLNGIFQKMALDKNQTDAVNFSALIQEITETIPLKYTRKDPADENSSFCSWNAASLNYLKTSILELLKNPAEEEENAFPIIYTQEIIFIYGSREELSKITDLKKVFPEEQEKETSRFWFYKEITENDFSPYNLKISGKKLLQVLQNPADFRKDFQLFDKIFTSYFFRKETEEEKTQFKKYFFTLYFFTLTPFFIEAIIWNKGDGSNGKTAFLNWIINHIISPRLTHQMTAASFKTSAFAFDGIQDKLISWIEEMPEEASPEIIKQWASPSLTVDRKGKISQTIKSTYQPILNTNRPTLKVNDSSNGTFRRFFPIIWKYRRDDPEHLKQWNTPQEWNQFQQSKITPLIFIFYCFQALDEVFKSTEAQIIASTISAPEGKIIPKLEAEARNQFIDKNDSITAFLIEDLKQNENNSLISQLQQAEPINENQILEAYNWHTKRAEIPEKYKLQKKTIIAQFKEKAQRLTGNVLQEIEIKNPEYQENPKTSISRIIKAFQRIDAQKVKETQQQVAPINEVNSIKNELKNEGIDWDN